MKRRKRNGLLGGMAAVLVILTCVMGGVVWDKWQNRSGSAEGMEAASREEAILTGNSGNVTEKMVTLPDYVQKEIIPVNGVGRRGEMLEGVQDIVIHYVGNPGTSAEQNRSYYAQPETQVSSHFLIGMEGEVILCVPLAEKSSASNDRNRDTISIEVCHPAADGKFTDASYDRLVELTAWLCEVYELDSTHVIRHYDITGKECPLYFVEHAEAWTQFLQDVEEQIAADS